MKNVGDFYSSDINMLRNNFCSFMRVIFSKIFLIAKARAICSLLAYFPSEYYSRQNNLK
jgi:hypothetical protein